jgi:hypothetical protein
MSDPLTFSIVIPVYNRAKLVQRAIASCLMQRHPSFEVIVVDDGSTDDTAATVAATTDPRVRLIQQPNCGVCPARNRGADEARGEWVVCLDSDDELVPGALELMETDIRRVPADIHGFRFMCRLDDGTTSPVPPLGGEVWDYAAHLRWLDVAWHGRQETMPCVRRRTFDTVRYPNGRGSLEVLYHMDFAAQFLTVASPVVARCYHSDAADQFSRPKIDRTLAWAPDYVRTFQALLGRHGDAMARWAPALLVEYTRALATQQFFTGDRRAGLRTIGRLIGARQAPFSAWVVLGLGVVSPRALAHAQAYRMRWRTRTAA